MESHLQPFVVPHSFFSQFTQVASHLFTLSTHFFASLKPLLQIHCPFSHSEQFWSQLSIRKLLICDFWLFNEFNDISPTFLFFSPANWFLKSSFFLMLTLCKFLFVFPAETQIATKLFIIKSKNIILSFLILFVSFNSWIYINHYSIVKKTKIFQ